jgi:hypothetical protein
MPTTNSKDPADHTQGNGWEPATPEDVAPTSRPGAPPGPVPPDEDRGEWRPNAPETWEAAAQAVQESPEAQARREKAAGVGTLPRRRRSGTHPGSGGRKTSGRDWDKYSPKRRRRRRRRIILTLAGVAVVVAGVAIVADAYVQTFHVYQSLKDITPKLTDARASLAKGEIPAGDPFGEATALANDAQSELDNARPTLRWVAAVPFVNRPIQAVRLATTAASEESQAATIVRDIVEEVLGPAAVEGGSTTSGDKGVPVFKDGVVDVKLLTSLAPRLQDLLDHLNAGEAAVRAIPGIPFVPQVQGLKEEALSESTKAKALAGRAISVLKLVPSFFGSKEPRTYFLALQQNAALRGTGGSVLAYALVNITNGRLSLLRAGGIHSIDPHNGVFVKLPPAVSWYLDTAKVGPHIPNGVNYTPDFPIVASVWKAQMSKLGYPVDGVIAIDPVAVAAMMKGSPPFTVRAYPQEISPANVVDIVENKQFFQPKQLQDALPGELVKQAFKAFLHPADMVQTLHQLSTVMVERHVQMWSSKPDEQSFLHTLGWDGGLRRVHGDFLALAQQNRLANKIDYYATQDINYTVTVHADGSTSSTYALTMHNAAPGLPPDYPAGVVGAPRFEGNDRGMMNLYVPKHAVFKSVSPLGPTLPPREVNPPGFVQHVESDWYRVFTQTLDTPLGKSATLTYTYTTPKVIFNTESGKVYQLTVQHQPLVEPANMFVKVIFPKGTVIKDAPGWTVNGNTATKTTVLERDFTTRIEY